MSRRVLFPLAILAVIQFSFGIALSPTSLAEEWKFRVKPRGTLKVVDLFLPSASALWNYAEPLVFCLKNSLNNL